MSSTVKPALNMDPFLRRKWTNYFRMFDANHDGKLTKEDFVEIGRRIAAMAPGDEVRKEAIRKMVLKDWDRLFNQDGKTVEVKPDELLQSFSEKTSEELAKLAHDYCPIVFQAVDTDGDGFIQFSEYKNYFCVLFQDDKEARASFDAIDTNKDGILSLEEFRNAWIEFLSGKDQQSPYRLMLGPLD